MAMSTNLRRKRRHLEQLYGAELTQALLIAKLTGSRYLAPLSYRTAYMSTFLAETNRLAILRAMHSIQRSHDKAKTFCPPEALARARHKDSYRL